MSRIDDADYWHDRVEEVLTRMSETKDETAKAILLRISADYLRMAQLAEERLAKRRIPHHPLPRPADQGG